MIRLCSMLLLGSLLYADGPQDNKPEAVRAIPPKGSPVSESDRAELQQGLASLANDIATLRKTGKNLELLPDVEIFHKAVHDVLKYDEIYVEKGRDDVKTCRRLLKLGQERASQLKEGKPTWTSATGLVVRGYRSKIDDSVQPYGIVVPAGFTPGFPGKLRCDFWWHGRGEKLTEANFIEQRLANAGEFVPAGAFVIHPYGRYCNANKFAGEIDTLEVLEHAKKHYPIDESRLVARGFSMGGAACWQFATHHPTLWVAAAPGAGFAETPEFLNNFQNEQVKPAWYEERLWRMYNATDHALNLHNLPTVAYSGEIDKQKQAADVMARELEKFDIDLVHIIGLKTGHKYEPIAKKTINELIDPIASNGRPGMVYDLKFVTYTLRYQNCAWLRLDGLEKHWEMARVDGIFNAGGFNLTTRNVTALTIDVNGADTWPGYLDYPCTVAIDETPFTFEKRRSDRGFKASFRKVDGVWKQMKLNAMPEGLHKVHGVQGPIDDAFMDRFIFVTPAGRDTSAVGQWCDAEMQRAIREWRRVFRGEPIVKKESEITDADIASANLILWGTPASNALMKKTLPQLPLEWTADSLQFGGQRYTGNSHVPLIIYPNPMNPKKYVVLNSGFTFREYDALNNARQTPKLPDYAIVDITTPPNNRSPGNVVRAGFFDEQWKVQRGDGK